MNLTQFESYLRNLAPRVMEECAKSDARVIQEAMRLAVTYSSGPYKQAELTAAGHPYSRRAPNASYDPTIINAQSGVFRASWVVPAQEHTAGGILTRCINTDPKAAYMLGTDRMVPRRIDTRVLTEIMPRREAGLRDAVKRALKAL